MDDDAEIIAASEKREAALAQLREAVAACGEADLTQHEILQAVHPLFTEDDVYIEGALFDHLEDGEASEVLRIIYGVLPQGGTLVFSVSRQSRSAILKLCDAARIPGMNVVIRRERDSLGVTITKLQS